MNTYVTTEQLQSWRRTMRNNALVWRVQTQWGEDDPETVRSLELAKLYRDLANGRLRPWDEREAA